MRAEYPARWFEPPDDRGKVLCTLCPRGCRLGDGQTGFCAVRANRGGRLISLAYGHPHGFGVDPIEKKPLNHFFPATDILSFGTVGCNLGCRVCQNWSSSRERRVHPGPALPPEAVVDAAVAHGCPSIAFTYNDPVIFAEYAIDVARAAHARGLRTVAVTAGYINAAPRAELFAHMDAANVDLKAMSERFYKKMSAARLGPVLETLDYLARETDVWVELTNLVIPGHNDSDRDLANLSEWVAEHMGVDTPVHFSAFHPDHRLLSVGRTPLATLDRARHIAEAAGLRYVFTGNVHDPVGQSTRCPGCGHTVIGRQGFGITAYHLDAQGRCGTCGEAIVGRFGASLGGS